ncbi:MAG: hypothetical protein IJM90_01355 [Firmicutes bacterium]|nr:hypothetical protein [Bacillota bacterium]
MKWKEKNNREKRCAAMLGMTTVIVLAILFASCVPATASTSEGRGGGEEIMFTSLYDNQEMEFDSASNPLYLDGEGKTAAVFVREIQPEEPDINPDYAGDDLFADEMYEYIVDHQDGYVMRISLGKDRNWDELVNDTGDETISSEKAIEMAKGLFEKYLADFISEDSDRVCDVSGTRWYLVTVGETIDGIPTGVCAPMVLISHAGTLLLANFEVNRPSNQNNLSEEEAVWKAIDYFVSSPHSAVEGELTEDNVIENTLIIQMDGRLVRMIMFSYQRRIGELTFESSGGVILDAETGELIDILLAG